MVEVFKTNITDKIVADTIVKRLQGYFPFAKINVDTDDCDHVLRIEGKAIHAASVIEWVKELGCDCEALN